MNKQRSYKSANSSEAVNINTINPPTNNTDNTYNKDIIEKAVEEVAEVTINALIKEAMETSIGSTIGRENADRVADLVEAVVDPLVDEGVDIIVEEIESLDHLNPDGYFTSFMKFIRIW